MEVITSLDNKLIKRLAKLKDKKYRDLEDIFLIETEHLIEEAYRCGMLEMVLVLENEDINLDVKKVYVTKNILNKLSSLNSNIKYIGVARKFIPKGYGNRLILLDNLQDPGNLGTIIRTADACGASAVILSKGSVDVYNGKVLRSTMGSIFHLPVITDTDIKEVINTLKKNNIKVYAAHLKGVKTPYSFELKNDIAYLIGNEANGLKAETSDMADEYIKIPMPGQAESLNASVAAAVLMYETVRQREVVK